MTAAGLQLTGSIAESLTESVLAKGKALANDAGASGKSHAHMAKAARDFESFLYGHMFKTMYNSVPKSEFTQNSMGNDIFMQLFIDEASKQNLEHGSNGIAAILMKQYEANMSSKDKAAVETLRKSGTSTALTTPHIESTGGETTKLNAIQDALASMVGRLAAGRVTSEYGMRKHPIHGGMRMHDGMDFGLSQGTELYSPVRGKVAFAGQMGGYGNTVIIDHGQGWMTKYGHLSEITVKEGDEINQGNVLGKVGSTGVSTGPHLHLEVLRDGKTVDPAELAAGKLPSDF